MRKLVEGAAVWLAIVASSASAMAWEPTKPVEIVVAAGAGGASDQMARMMQAAIQKNNLMKQPMVVSLKGGASGAEALMYMKSSDGDANKVLIAYSLIYMLPLSAKIHFNWRDLTPGAKFADLPYKSGGEAATQLVGKHTEANVNNPSENLEVWRAGQVRALCVFDKERIEYKAKVTAEMSWHDVTTCKT